MQIALAVAERLERADRFDDVIAVLSGTAVALQHIAQLFGERGHTEAIDSTQTFLAVPMIALYFLGVGVAYIFGKKYD